MTTLKYPDPVTGAWKILGGVPPDAPVDGSAYARKDGAWSKVSLDFLGIGATAVAASKLSPGAQINGVAFDGSANITVADSTRVLRAGDTMTGVLNLAPPLASPSLTLNKPSSVNYANCIVGQTAGLIKWQIQPGSGGGGGADDFDIFRYDNAGVLVDSVFHIVRANAEADFTGDVWTKKNQPRFFMENTAAPANNKKAGLQLNSDGALWMLRFTDDMAGVLNYVRLNADNTVVVSGSGVTIATGLTVNANIVNGSAQVATGSIELGPPASATTPFVDFHSSGTSSDYDSRIIATGGNATPGNGALSYTAYSGHTFNGYTQFNSGVNATNNITISTYDYPCLFLDAGAGRKKIVRCQPDNAFAIINAANTVELMNVTDYGRIRMSNGYGCRQGGNGQFGSNIFNFYWDGSGVQVWIDTSYMNYMSLASDERVKKDIVPLSDDETFLQIQPIEFHFADIGIFKDDGREHWGFSAQNLAPLFPTMVVGDVNAMTEDGDPQPASLDPTAILAQTVLQVQALMREMKSLKQKLESPP